MATDTPQNDTNAKKGYATPGRRSKTAESVTTSREQTGNPILRPFMGIFTYFAEVKAELDKVVWPTREQTQRLTVIVTIATIISSLILGGLSLFMGEFIRIGLSTPMLFVITFVIIIAVTVLWVQGMLPRILSSMGSDEKR
ncbi:MAG: preprotein translocase subunit SecE [Aggregatilineales bacterium]